MIKVLVTTIFISIFSSQTFAKNKFCVIGGGGEPTDKETTIFDAQFKNMSDFAKRSDYSSCTYFNGGHAKTDEIRKNGFTQASENSDFSASSYNTFLKNMLSDIENGKIKKDEQALIYIAAHGEKSYASSGAHNLAGKGAILNAADFKSAERIDLATLQDVIIAAENKGIKLAIVDSSCFSGHTLKLKTKNTCIMTSTGTDNYAYSSNPLKDVLTSPYKNLESFSNLFSKNINDKKFSNLEEVFLNARTNSFGADFPQMNVAEDKLAQEKIYKEISRYLDIEAIPVDMLEGLFKKLNSNEAICKFEDSFQSSMTQISSLEKNINKVLENDPSLKQLKTYLAKYHSLIINKARSQVGLNSGEFQKVQVTLNGKTQDYDLKTFLFIDADKMINERKTSLKLALSELKVDERYEQIKSVQEAEFGSEISYYKDVAKEQKRLINSSPKIKALYSGIQEWNRDEDKNALLAFQIGIEARKVAQKLYDAQTKGKAKSQSNPCRDFKL